MLSVVKFSLLVENYISIVNPIHIIRHKVQNKWMLQIHTQVKNKWTILDQHAWLIIDQSIVHFNMVSGELIAFQYNLHDHLVNPEVAIRSILSELSQYICIYMLHFTHISLKYREFDRSEVNCWTRKLGNICEFGKAIDSFSHCVRD